VTDTAKVATKDLTFITSIYEKALFTLRKHFSYQFFIFVTLFAAEAPKSFCVTKNIKPKNRWLSRNKGFCHPTTNSRPPNFLDGIIEV